MSTCRGCPSQTKKVDDNQRTNFWCGTDSDEDFLIIDRTKHFLQMITVTYWQTKSKNQFKTRLLCEISPRTSLLRQTMSPKPFGSDWDTTYMCFQTCRKHLPIGLANSVQAMDCTVSKRMRNAIWIKSERYWSVHSHSNRSRSYATGFVIF